MILHITFFSSACPFYYAQFSADPVAALEEEIGVE